MTLKNLVSWGAALLALACGSGGDERYAAADLALETAGDDLVGEGHCATVHQVPGDCPTDIEWRNHGQYVSCVAKYLSARVESGDISEDDRAELVQTAAQSDVGLRQGPPDGAQDAEEPDYSQHFADECPPTPED